MENWEAKNSMKAMAGERPSVAFAVSSGTGWKMSFPNDMHLSVDIGPQSNCDNRGKNRNEYARAHSYTCESNTAEVVIWKDGMPDDCTQPVFHHLFGDDDPVTGRKRFRSIWEYNGPDAQIHRGNDNKQTHMSKNWARPSTVVGFVPLYALLEVIDYLKNLTAEEATVYDKA